jgi:hypothetical protein
MDIVIPPLVIDLPTEVMSGVVERDGGLLDDDVAVVGMCLVTTRRGEHDGQQSYNMLPRLPIQVISLGSREAFIVLPTNACFQEHSWSGFHPCPTSIVDRSCSLVDPENHLNIFKTHHNGRQPRPSQESHERVNPDVS